MRDDVYGFKMRHAKSLGWSKRRDWFEVDIEKNSVRFYLDEFRRTSG